MQIDPSSKPAESPLKNCLVRYVEIWRPDSDRLILQSATVLESSDARKVEHSKSMIRQGDGIAGSAWQQKAAVIFQDRPCIVLQQAERETGIELAAMLAVPFFENGALVNVIVFGFGRGHGGVEIWARDDRDELSISGSFYDGLPTFDFMSRHVRFPKGAGLPGNCWKRSQPGMISQPGMNPDFIRSFDQDPAELATCLGVPISHEYGYPASILLFLSSTDSPFARRIDLLTCDTDAPTEEEPFPGIEITDWQSSDESISDFQIRWNSVCKRLASTRQAILMDRSQTDLPNGFHSALVIPLFSKQQISNVIGLLF